MPEGTANIVPVPSSRADIHSFTAMCAYQAGPATLDVLVPLDVGARRNWPVVWVLPAMPADEPRHGNGLEELRRHDLHNRIGFIAVRPAFVVTPWYADHPIDPARRHESYLLDVVLPWLESNYPVSSEPRDRWLLGFSKSGCGAWSLLLRHPDVFSRAAAWDAPLMQTQPDRWNMQDVFAGPAHFADYCIPALLQRRRDLLRRGAHRLVLLGYDNFRDHVTAAHRFLEELGVPHLYANDTRRPHRWDSGWVPEAVSLLTAASGARDLASCGVGRHQAEANGRHASRPHS